MNYNYFRRLLLIISAVIFISTTVIAQVEAQKNERRPNVRQIVKDTVNLTIDKLWEKYSTARGKTAGGKLQCPKFDKPIFNPFTVYYLNNSAPPCTVFPMIDVAIDTANPRYAQSEKEYNSIRKVENADQLIVMLYIVNGADETLNRQITTAKNVTVKAQTEIGGSGNLRSLYATFTGNNIKTLTSSVTVQIGSDEELRVVENSGVMYNYNGYAIRGAMTMNIGNSITYLDDLGAGTEYSLFFSYKIKIVKKNKNLEKMSK
jgi:hypothetical protein